MTTAFSRGRLVALALLPFLAAACADNGNTGPDDVAPVITIGGVADGGSYAPPVTITIQVAPGSYTATLNGESIVSGETVSQAGDYTLVVSGRNGTARVTETIDFTVESFGTDDVLIVRLFDLEDGTAGAPGDAILITDSSSAGQFHMLIDAGARNNVDGYTRDRLNQLGVDTLRVMQLTHAHADHFAGMDEILESGIHVTSFVYSGQDRALASYNDVLTTAAAHADTLRVMQLTHAHADHFAGMDEILESGIHVTSFVYGGQERALASYNDVIATAAAHADTVTELRALRALELGGGSVPTVVTMIHPHPDYDDAVDDDGADINEGSIGTLVEHGDFRMYFTGDGQLDANTRWRLDFAGLSGNVDILKVGHHAANDATDSPWLSHSSFEVAAVSANGISHPRIGALDRLNDVSTTIYCTNVHGEIRITVDEGGNYTVTVAKNAGQPCVAGSDAST